MVFVLIVFLVYHSRYYSVVVMAENRQGPGHWVGIFSLLFSTMTGTMSVGHGGH